MAELPRPLPGFYYDSTVQRYFPESSKPRSPAVQDCKSDDEGHSNTRGRRAIGGPSPPGSFRKLEGLLYRSDIGRIAHIHQMRALSTLRLRHRSRLNIHPSSYSGEAVCLAVTRDFHVAGASDGDLYVRRRGDVSASAQGPENWGPWIIEKSLATMITGVAILNDRCFAASLGPAPQIAVTHIERSGESYTYELPKTVRDVRAATFTPTGIALGCSGRAFFTPSADAIHSNMSLLPTRSDVTAVHLEKNELFLGTRGGGVFLWDIRLPPKSLQETIALTTSVTNLHTLYDFDVLTCLMDGTVDVYDLRFMRQSAGRRLPPTKSLRGHRNAYTLGLGCCVSDHENALFLAGQDLRIRAWSLRTGERLVGADSADNPLRRTFLRPVKAMAVGCGEPGTPELHAVDGYVSYIWVP